MSRNRSLGSNNASNKLGTSLSSKGFSDFEHRWMLPNFIFLFLQQLLPMDSASVSLICPLEKLLLSPTEMRF